MLANLTHSAIFAGKSGLVTIYLNCYSQITLLAEAIGE